MKDTKSAIFEVAYRFLGPEELEAFAAEDDPTKSWIHFVFTDDIPNANKKRVPVEEFDNIIKSGKHMPIKKKVGETSPDHEGVIPMGTIASLKRELGETKNLIEGLGILWKREFPEDVASLKKAFDKGESIDFSWEILYSEEVAEEKDISALKGCTTRAITIVDLPAYEGRTRALAMASTKESFEERQEKIRTALDKFRLDRDGFDSSRYWLIETFVDTIVVKDSEDGNYYEVSYSIKLDGITFDFETKVKVEREYVKASEENREEKLITGVASKEALAAAGEKEKEAQRKRAAKYGIQIRPDGNVTKPKEYAHLNDSQFADPVNYAYPIDKTHILAALRYWGKPANKAKYNSKSQAIITRRMMAAAKRFGVKSVQEKEEKSMLNFEVMKEMLEGLEPEESVAAVADKLKELFEDLESLRAFKTEREEEEAKAVLLKTRLAKMKEAGLEVSNEDVEKKAKTWLSMDDEAFEFYINELIAFSTAVKEGKASIPNVRGEVEEESDLDIVKEGFKEIFKESKSETDKEE